MKLIIILLLNSFSLAAFAQEGKEVKKVKVKCPENTQFIDFTDPTTKDRTLFCQATKEGKLVKHGGVLTYNKDGVLIKSEFYDMGVSQTGKVDKGIKIDKAN